MESLPGTVCIVGCGLIGGSLGLALKSLPDPPAVSAWDIDPKVAERAVERGACDRASSRLEDAVVSADLVVLCVPAPAIHDLAARLSATPSTAFITDVCSVKSPVCELMDRQAAGRFVGGHPMAGSERGGIEGAREDLFQGAVWAVTPTEETSPAAVATVEALIAAVGASPLHCSPEDHDKWVGALSHLPHLMAFGLVAACAKQVPQPGRSLAATSFRSAARVAASDPALWASILLSNRQATLEALDAFEGWLSEARAAMNSGDSQSLQALLKESVSSLSEFRDTDSGR